MRSLLSLFLLLTLAACSGDPAVSPAEAPRDTESLARPPACRPIPIPPNPTCEELQRLVDHWLRCADRCVDNDDCAVMPVPGTFCRNWCARAEGVAAAGTYLDALGAALAQHGCQTAGCACVRPPSAAVCSAGHCQPQQ